MANDLLVGSISLSIGITASYSDGCCSIGISITFSMDIYLFSRSRDDWDDYPSYGSSDYSIEEPEIRLSNKEYIEKEADVLSQLFAMWDKSFTRLQEEYSTKLLENQEELDLAVTTFAKEQYRIANLIEKTIGRIDEWLENNSVSEDDLEDFYYLLSHAFQLIRDLSMTFVLGDISLRSAITPSETAQKIAEKWLRKNPNLNCVPMIKKRAELSNAIEKLTQNIIDKNNDYTWSKQKLAAIKNNIAEAKEKLERENYKKKLYSEDSSAEEVTHVQQMISLKEERLSKTKEYIWQVQQQIDGLGMFSGGKKKQLGVELASLNKEVVDLQLELQKLKDNLAGLERQNLSTQDNIGLNENSQIIDSEIEKEKLERQMELIQKNVQDYSSEIEKISKEYESLIQKFKKVG